MTNITQVSGTIYTTFFHEGMDTPELGSTITVAGVTPSDFNGEWVVLAYSDNTCMIQLPNPGTYVSGGTLE